MKENNELSKPILTLMSDWDQKTMNTVKYLLTSSINSPFIVQRSEVLVGAKPYKCTT